jgi:hypothetical protein
MMAGGFGSASRLWMVLLAVFGLVAATAAGASATPGWYECAKTLKNHEKRYEGTFSDRACTVESSPEERAAGKNNKFVLKPGIGKGRPYTFNGGSGLLHVVIPRTGRGPFGGGAHLEIRCTSLRGAGQPVLPNKVERVTFEFRGCTILATPCQSGALHGIVVTNRLAGELIDIEGGSGVGLLLHGEETPVIVSYVCKEAFAARVSGGSVIAEQTGNIGVVNKRFSDVFKVGPALGEVEYQGGVQYTPFVNVPTHGTGGAVGEDFLFSEINELELPPTAGPLPWGMEVVAEDKGEKNVLIMP